MCSGVIGRSLNLLCTQFASPMGPEGAEQRNMRSFLRGKKKKYRWLTTKKKKQDVISLRQVFQIQAFRTKPSRKENKSGIEFTFSKQVANSGQFHIEDGFTKSPAQALFTLRLLHLIVMRKQNHDLLVSLSPKLMSSQSGSPRKTDLPNNLSLSPSDSLSGSFSMHVKGVRIAKSGKNPFRGSAGGSDQLTSKAGRRGSPQPAWRKIQHLRKKPLSRILLQRRSDAMLFFLAFVHSNSLLREGMLTQFRQKSATSRKQKVRCVFSSNCSCCVISYHYIHDPVLFVYA